VRRDIYLCTEIALFVLNLSDIIFLRTAPHTWPSTTITVISRCEIDYGAHQCLTVQASRERINPPLRQLRHACAASNALQTINKRGTEFHLKKCTSQTFLTNGSQVLAVVNEPTGHVGDFALQINLIGALITHYNHISVAEKLHCVSETHLFLQSPLNQKLIEFVRTCVIPKQD